MGEGRPRARVRRSGCRKLLNREGELSPDTVDAQLSPRPPPPPAPLPIASASPSERQNLERLLYFIHTLTRLSVVSNIFILILQRGKPGHRTVKGHC